MRRSLFAALLFLSLPFISAHDASAETLVVNARPVPLDVDDPRRTRVGQLTWLGGLSLSSTHDRFGGLSSLLISPDGSRMLATSDHGWWFSAELSYDDTGRLSGVRSAKIAPIRGTDGQPLTEREERDSEGLALAPDGAVLVSFERDDRILRYETADPFDADGLAGVTPSELPRAPGFAKLRSNEGLEALSDLADGRLIVIAEGHDDDDPLRPAWVFENEADSVALSYRREARFRPTGAAVSPDGDLLVLERRYTLIGGVSANIKRVRQADIVAGRTLKGEQLATLKAPITVDNMEGIATRRGPNGETLIYLISDNNFSTWLQRTLLLEFALAPGGG